MTRKLTKAEFIERARKVHGDRYDYSKVEYVNNSTKVKVICPEHGPFLITPNHHLQSKAGCPVCGGTARFTTEQFIERARAIHGNRYDYSRVGYINNRKKVIIICPAHGPFAQTPSTHLSGRRCYECYGTPKKTTEQFIEEARAVHGDLYDYSLVEYDGLSKPVTIICHEHGPFSTRAGNHLYRKSGCPQCGDVRTKAAITNTTAQFIEAARAIHGNRYDYHLVEYRNANTRVEIICPEHGVFHQIPNAHTTQEQGCPKCGSVQAGQSNALSKDEFIKAARAVHGNKYDYSHAEYVNVGTKVKIICPDHGPFIQTSRDHIHSGAGCRQCAYTGINFEVPGFLYYLRISTRTHDFWKIGITTQDIERRFTNTDRKWIKVLKTWAYGKTRDAFEREQSILKKYKEWRYEGLDRPLVGGGNTELFTRDVLGLDSENK